MVRAYQVHGISTKPLYDEPVLLARLDMIVINQVHGMRQECSTHKNLFAADHDVVREWDDRKHARSVNRHADVGFDKPTCLLAPCIRFAVVTERQAVGGTLGTAARRKKAFISSDKINQVQACWTTKVMPS